MASTQTTVAGDAGELAGLRRERRVRRPWRVLFVLYAVALTIGTHWPRLQLGTEEVRISDKLLHAAAFGAATLLLWRTGWVHRARWLLLAGVAWALLDEVSQGIPALGRTMSLVDALASGIGVAAAAALLWAFGPIGDPSGVAGLAQRRRRWALDEALGSWRAIGVCALAGLLVAPVGAILGRSIFSLPRVEQPDVGLELGILVGLGTGALMAMEVLRRRVLQRRSRACFECDADASAAPFDSRGTGACSTCGTSLRITQWDEPPQPPSLSAPRLILVATLAAAVLVLFAFVATLALGWLAINLRWSWLRELAGLALGGGGPESYDLRLLGEFFWLSMIAAVAIRWARRLLARAVDRQHLRCLGCGFDLRATPTRDGRGRCPECGQEFFAAGLTGTGALGSSLPASASSEG